MKRIVPGLVAAIVFAVAAAAEPARFWQALPSLPAGIAGFGLRASHETIEVAGGTTWNAGKKQTLAACWRWSAADGRWQPLAPLPRPVAHGAFTAYPGGLVLAGGSDGVATRPEILLLESAGGIRTIGSLAEPSGYAGSAVRGATLFILGGTPDLNDLSQLRARFLGIDLPTGRAEPLPEYPDGPVMHARLAALNERILVFPGGSFDATHRRAGNLSGVWSYDPGRRRWSRHRDYPFPVRGLAVCALDGDRHVFTAGGYRSVGAEGEVRMTGECFLYDAEHDSYHLLPPLPYAAMLMEAARDEEWVYVMGGEDRARHRAAQAYRARITEVLSVGR